VSSGHVPFLGQLGAEAADALVGRARHRTARKGEAVLRAGAAGDEAVVILSGSVRLVAFGLDDREVALALRGPGELLGEMAALGGQRRTASAIAVDDHVEVGFLPAADFRAFLREYPDAALVLIRMLVRRLAEADRDRVDLATQDSVGRVAKRLLELSSEHNAVELNLTQEELATWTGSTRETVARALRLMRQLGWVATDHRKITVLDPAALRERCGESG
jgi:CRP-like cAMP-binding protein